MIKANDPRLKSWVEVPQGSDFPIQNLPFGIFRTRYLSAVAGVAIGNYVLDLVYLHEHGYFKDIGLPPGIFNQQYLNGFLELGRMKARQVRDRVSEVLQHDNKELQSDLAAREIALIPMQEVDMLMPVRIPNYTDFYSCEQHARNVGEIFRDPKTALLPNWKHLPIAYHGRASSIVVSGTPIHRPKGQIKLPDEALPVFGISNKLDFELELAFITCSKTMLGQSISTAHVEDHIFGMVLFNDWSARDIQQWEYVPLGPFAGKNFGSTISPWIITLDALEPFRDEGMKQDQPILPYLTFAGKKSFDINLEVFLKPENKEETKISHANFRHMYWNMNQQLAHQTANGCNIQVGDLYASGTISGSSPGTYGSLLELTWNGEQPIKLADGSKRKFIEDNDTIILRAYAEKDGVRIGFGECTGKIIPVN